MSAITEFLDTDITNTDLYKALETERYKRGTEAVEHVYNRWKASFTPPPVIHPTEEKYPEQTKMFREILDEMYQTHLKKNADYSHWNINATGIVGLVTRFWDKCARIMSLSGFDIGTGEYHGPKKNMVEDESLMDSFADAGVYSVIARIWASGKWGK